VLLSATVTWWHQQWLLLRATATWWPPAVTVVTRNSHMVATSSGVKYKHSTSEQLKCKTLQKVMIGNVRIHEC
jgi:hypothetical protein